MTPQETKRDAIIGAYCSWYGFNFADEEQDLPPLVLMDANVLKTLLHLVSELDAETTRQETALARFMDAATEDLRELYTALKEQELRRLQDEIGPLDATPPPAPDETTETTDASEAE